MDMEFERFHGKFGNSITVHLTNSSFTFAERNASESHAFNRLSNGDDSYDVINEYYGKERVSKIQEDKTRKREV